MIICQLLVHVGLVMPCMGSVDVCQQSSLTNFLACDLACHWNSVHSLVVDNLMQVLIAKNILSVSSQ